MIATVSVQNGAELGAPEAGVPVQGREIQIAQRQNSPSDYTLGNPFFPKNQSRMCTGMGKNAGKYSRGCSRTESFVS